MKKKNRNSGFTLIEVLVAFGLASILLLAIIRALVIAFQASKFASDRIDFNGLAAIIAVRTQGQNMEQGLAQSLASCATVFKVNTDSSCTGAKQSDGLLCPKMFPLDAQKRPKFALGESYAMQFSSDGDSAAPMLKSMGTTINNVKYQLQLKIQDIGCNNSTNANCIGTLELYFFRAQGLGMQLHKQQIAALSFSVNDTGGVHGCGPGLTNIGWNGTMKNGDTSLSGPNDGFATGATNCVFHNPSSVSAGTPFADFVCPAGQYIAGVRQEYVDTWDNVKLKGTVGSYLYSVNPLTPITRVSGYYCCHVAK